MLGASFSPRESDENISEIIENTFQRHLKGLYSPKIREKARDYYEGHKSQLYNKFSSLANAINFSIFDSKGSFRGRYETRYFDRYVLIGNNTSSPGFISGPIFKGTWEIEVALHTLVSGQCTLEIDIWTGKNTDAWEVESDQLIPKSNPDSISLRTEGIKKAYPSEGNEMKWFAGEPHVHSYHSDGSLSPSQLKDVMHRRGLSYFALTDHNTTSGLEEIQQSDKSTILPGMEVTAFRGHLTALGTTDYLDWTIIEGQSGVEKIISRIHEKEGIAAIAHPYSLPDPLCGGCRWEYQNIPYEKLDAIEVWNGNYGDNSMEIESAIAHYVDVLNQGYHISAISGLDFHSLDDLTIDSPVTYIKSKNPTSGNLLKSISKGHAIISSGPQAELLLLNESREITANVGGEANFLSGERGQVAVKILDFASDGLELRLFKKKNLWHRKIINERQMITYPYEHKEDNFIRLEIRDPLTNKLKVFTNPIYINTRHEDSKN
ncbi:MAG: CehA/McbA family metallohydrolase [Candidatus Bipolaricaulia bacterium]